MNVLFHLSESHIVVLLIIKSSDDVSLREVVFLSVLNISSYALIFALNSV